MIRQIVKDVLFLEQKSEPATKEDKSIVTDLIDTLKANLDSCVGLAANMIGLKKTILVLDVYKRQVCNYKNRPSTTNSDIS